MIEFLESIDRQIVLSINGLNTPFWDEFMWIVSEKVTWIPLYLLLIFVGFKKLGWKVATVYVLATILAIGCTDFICSGIIKEAVQRYRPSHHLLLTDKLHFYSDGAGFIYKGGMYGFVSSHAGNFFALAWFVGLVFRSTVKVILPSLLVIGGVISFSRIYLGVHYLSDIIGGFIVGTTVAWLVYRFVYLKVSQKINRSLVD